MSRATLRRTLCSLFAAASLAALATAPAARADDIYGSWAAPDRWSLGLMLGGPTGLTLEKNLPSGNAWDLGLGFIYGPGIRLHGDYLWTIAGSNTDSDLFIRFQIGVGALVGSLTHPCEFYGSFGDCNNGFYAGARVPFVLELWPRGAPLNFGLEIAPVIAFNSAGVGGFLDAFVFVRFVL